MSKETKWRESGLVIERMLYYRYRWLNYRIQDLYRHIK